VTGPAALIAVGAGLVLAALAVVLALLPAAPW
jgi:hypothetical protein